MVGDREHDIIGALNNGMASIGVTYGYGHRQELQRAGAVFIVDSPMELAHILLNIKVKDADEIQSRIHAKMSATQKWEAVLSLRETAWRLKMASVRSKHPDWNESKVTNEVRKVFLYAVT